MNFSKEIIEKAKTASSVEELLEMAKAEGVELSAADAETYFSFLHKGSQPLSDDELDQVAGGKGGWGVIAQFQNGQKVQFWPPEEDTWLVGKIIAMYPHDTCWTYKVKSSYESGKIYDNVPLEDPAYHTSVI